VLPYGSEELARSFRTVRLNTLAIARDIPADKYDFRPAPELRTVEKLLTHIALCYRFQHQIQAVEKRTSLEGFDFMAFMGKVAEQEATPRSKDEVIALLEKEGEVWASFLDAASDAFLVESISFPSPTPPASKTRLEMLMSVKEHEMHHRGQLMLVQRMLGIVPHLTRERQARAAQPQR
jgi:uncharacterized damage-inducible protein DinB